MGPAPLTPGMTRRDILKGPALALPPNVRLVTMRGPVCGPRARKAASACADVALRSPAGPTRLPRGLLQIR